MAEIAVIGGGASGLMAARRAALGLKRAGRGGEVLLLEGNPKPGKKLLATGNGRCNLTNLHIAPERYHGDPSAAAVLERVSAQRVLGELEEMGLLCQADGEGRVYPNSRQAAAVLQALLSTLAEAGAIVMSDHGPVTEILSGKGGFQIKTAGGARYTAAKCILACGGMAAPRLSQGGSGYELAKALGHSVTALSPSLVPLKTTAKACGALKGMRSKARAVLYQNGKVVWAESGEVIFGAGQLSGICIFNLSARLRETGLNRLEVGLDLLEQMELPAVAAYLTGLKRARPNLPAAQAFSGALNLRVGQELAKAAGLSWEKRLGEVSGEALARAARLAKDWRFPIIGPGPWEDAQITAGGVPLAEVRLETMESKICPGLYLTGELLDADGDCGGYNLHWAWATGLLAGDGAAKRRELES